MTRFLIPIILIGTAITLFFTFTNPIYQDIPTLKAQVSSYNEALGNSKALENERDKLTSKYNSIDPENISKLQKLLPDNIDNIRLILEIGKIAQPYGMSLKDVKYNADDPQQKTPSSNMIAGGPESVVSLKDYRVLNMDFSVSGTYDNFLKFTRDLESNLRIIDISSVVFSADNSDPKVNPSGAYKYNFSIKTYWLKN